MANSWCETEVPSRKLVIERVVKSKAMHLPLPRKATKEFAELYRCYAMQGP